MGTKGTPKRRDKLLQHISETGNITKACELACVQRRTYYKWRERSAEFAKRVDDCLEVACDRLELEARRRAHDGLARKKFDKGVPIIDPATGEQYIEYEYSDTLLIFLLKAHRPDKYRERVEHEHKGKVAHVHEMRNEERLAKLAAILAPARALQEAQKPSAGDLEGTRLLVITDETGSMDASAGSADGSVHVPGR